MEIQNKFKLELISSGDIVRKLAEKDPKVKGLMEAGEFAPDEAILGALTDKIRQVPKENGIIMDGFPRSIKQAQELEISLFKAGRSVDYIIYLNVSEEEVLKRIAKRLVCPKCGHVSEKGENICSKCHVGLERRPDDRPDIISERMSLYLERTIPVIEYYRKKGILLEVNGDQPIPAVASDILKALKEKNAY